MPGSEFLNRREFLEEAVALAPSGVVSLLIDGPIARPGYMPDPDPLGDLQVRQRVQAILDMRRGADLLLSRRDVDAKRLAYVGHSYNAATGAFLAGIDKRFKAFVLMAGNLSDEVDLRSKEYQDFRQKVGSEKLDAFVSRYAWLDPGKYVAHAAPAKVLMQFATQEDFINPSRAREYAAVVSDPKIFKLYEAPHALNAEARRDRIAFLVKELGLAMPDPAAMARVPELPQPAETAFAWPAGQKAAISLTYDDALVASDLNVAAPQLDRAELKGTFFLTGKGLRAGDVERWRGLAVAGHELGNHTVNHPCRRGTYDMPVQYNSESYSVDVLLTEIGVMNTLLTALDGKPQHALATPCEHTTVGDGQDYIAPLKASGMVTFIRDSSVMASFADGPKILGNGFVGTSGADMIAWVKQVESAGGLGVAVFHGVGGDYLSVTAEAHQQLLDYLATHRSTVWTAPFSEAMSYVAQRGR